MTWITDPGYLRLIGFALMNTVLIATVVIVVSNLLALPLAVYMQRTRGRLKPVIIGYSFFARAAPVLALLFALYYGLPRLGIYLEPIPSALVGLVFASTAYNLEFLRSGFEAVPRGQYDAAKALGLGPFATYRRVILPQAYSAASPALFSNAVQMVKGSSLASLVAVDELTAASTTLISETYKALEVLAFIGVLYALVAGIVITLQWAYERRQVWQRLRH